MSARVIQVIETDLETRGKGTEDSPVRRVKQYWSLDGELLAEVDPYAENERTGRVVSNALRGVARHEEWNRRP